MTDDVRALAERMYEAFNARDLAVAEAIFSADFVSHPLGTVGVDSVVKAWSGLHAMFFRVRDGRIAELWGLSSLSRLGR
ncbi:nuclear transport factor 2 family protein [Streptomyces sp. NBC_01231]|nr:nuclear transport factor 2 family protein [Streptomyces sp. NBC_01231]